MTQKNVPAMVECTCDRCGVFASWRAEQQQPGEFPHPVASGWQRIVRGGWCGDLCPGCIVDFGFFMKRGHDKAASE